MEKLIKELNRVSRELKRDKLTENQIKEYPYIKNLMNQIEKEKYSNFILKVMNEN